MTTTPILVARVGWLMACTCACFSAIASAAALFLTASSGAVPDPAFLVKTAIKALFFVGISGACYVGLRRNLRNAAYAEDAASSQVERPAVSRIILATATLLAIVLGFVRLDEYPAMQPDESYHMTVARNLAVYGTYASGSPEPGFVRFDDYDSVGPPVILPVAAAFRLGGVTIGSGRIASGLYFILLCGLAYFFVRMHAGALAAAFGVLLLGMSLMTPYLARTLYGEVPAFAWILAGLIAWRRSYTVPRFDTAFALLAGLCLGAALLCKEILAIAVCAVVVTAVYDRITHRRLAWRHLVPPFAGAAGVIVCFALVKWFYQSDTEAAIGSMATYQNYLLFGLDGLPAAMNWTLERVWILAPPAIALVGVTVTVLRRRYDPAMLTLALAAALFAYWWVFFTPGHIQRYLWFSCAATGLFSGMAIAMLIPRITDLRKGAIPLAAIAGLMVSQIPETASEIRRIVARDETQVVQKLASELKMLPRDSEVVTTEWVLQRTMNLLADRHIRVVPRPEEAPPTAYLIIDLNAHPGVNESESPIATAGPFSLFGPVRK